jgi:putative intracellular protease/amidase
MKINILLFDDFETLDVFGPVEIFGKVEDFELNYYSMSGSAVTSKQNTKIITEKISTADPKGILLIPGGQGTRPLVDNTVFINALRTVAETATYCLCVCTGSALLAKTGLLDGKKATSNKKSYDWVVRQNQAVDWIAQARWVTDGKYYTSSGVSAGIDMALAFVSDLKGEEKAVQISNHIEYIRNTDAAFDPFARNFIK